MQLAVGTIGALIGGSWGFTENPNKVSRVVLIVVTGSLSLYALAAWTHGVSWQTAFFSIPVLCLCAACGLHVYASLHRRQINIRWVRTVLTAAAAIMVGFVATLGLPLIIGLIFAGPTVLLAVAFCLSRTQESSLG